MVDHSSLILALALLATPGTVGIAHEMSKGISIVDSLQSCDLRALPLRTSTPWVVNEENSWHVLALLVPPRTIVVHEWTCLIGQHLQLTP